MTVNKTFALLELFSIEKKTLRVEEMADLLEMPISSVYRHVKSLKDHGYLREHDTGRYRLGYKFLEYASIVRADINITEVARPIMDKLTEDFQETTILSVLSDVNAVCLATSVPNHSIKVSSEEGKIMPLHSGASSKILLAYQDIKVLDKLVEEGRIERFTNQTPVLKSDILENLSLSKSQGYARSIGEVDEGVMSYGFPIRNFKGEVFASLAIAGPEYRLLKKEESVIIERFKKAVKHIERFV